MEAGVEIVFSFRVAADGNMCLQYYALPVEKSKTFVNAFEYLNSASKEDSSTSFDAVVPKAVEKVVVQV